MSNPNSTETVMDPIVKKPRGFALMDPAKRAEISRKGGVAAHASGRAHEWTPEAAAVAGSKGGVASHAKRRAQKDVAAQ